MPERTGSPLRPGGCLAELALYRFRDGAFRGENNEALPGLPGVLEALLAYWWGCCRGRRFPERADIDPVDIPTLLEHLLLVDVLRDPLDFHYRLVGGHIVEHGGRVIRGQTARSLLEDGQPPALQHEALRAGSAVAETLAPVCVELQYRPTTAELNKRLQGILLPLGPSDCDLTMLLGGLVFQE